LPFIDGRLWATGKREILTMEVFSLALSSTVLIRSQNFLNIFPASFFNDRSFEKKLYVFMRINTSYVLVTETADAR
jgi:hypothetical protein